MYTIGNHEFYKWVNVGYYLIDSDIYLLPVYSIVPKLSLLIALHKQLTG
jgi:hypothetical protein